MHAYNYSLSSDFGDNINLYQLHQEINNDNAITTNLIGIDLTGDDVDVNFDSQLSGAEQTVLNGLVSAHVPEADVGKNVINIPTSDNDIDLTTYMTIATFTFQGSNIIKNVTNIKIVGLMEEGGTSYDVRLYDVINGNNIASASFSNEDEAILDLGTITNIPTNESIFELQAKINGSSIAHIKNISIYHN